MCLFEPCGKITSKTDATLLWETTHCFRHERRHNFLLSKENFIFIFQSRIVSAIADFENYSSLTLKIKNGISIAHRGE